MFAHRGYLLYVLEFQHRLYALPTLSDCNPSARCSEFGHPLNPGARLSISGLPRSLTGLAHSMLGLGSLGSGRLPSVLGLRPSVPCLTLPAPSLTLSAPRLGFRFRVPGLWLAQSLMLFRPEFYELHDSMAQPGLFSAQSGRLAVSSGGKSSS